MRQEQLQQTLLSNSGFDTATLQYLLACPTTFSVAATKRLPQLSSQRHVANAQSIHCHIKILTLLNTIANRTDVRKHFFDRLGFLRRSVKTAVAYSLIDHELDVGLCLCSSLLILSHAKLSDELVGISVLWKHQNFDFKIFRQEDFNRLFCRLHTRAVAIIIEYDLARKPA